MQKKANKLVFPPKNRHKREHINGRKYRSKYISKIKNHWNINYQCKCKVLISPGKHLVPWKTTSVKTHYYRVVLRAPEHQSLKRANKPLGLMPVTGEQGEESKMSKKTLVFKEHQHTFTTQDGPARKNNQEQGNSERNFLYTNG